MNLKSLAALALVPLVPLVSAGPGAYAICQTGCNGLAVTCYAAAGFVFGTTIVGAPPAILACNSALGACMVACVAAGFAPTP